MTIINKKHPEILGSTSGKKDCYMSIHDDRLFFTHTAAMRFKLTPGKYMHFINDGKYWSFFQDNDPDGFMIQKDGKPSSNAVMVCNRALITMFIRSTKHPLKTRLYLVESGSIHNGLSVIEIMTHKTFNQMLKEI